MKELDWWPCPRRLKLAWTYAHGLIRVFAVRSEGNSRPTLSPKLIWVFSWCRTTLLVVAVPVADPEGALGVAWAPSPLPFLNILWKWNNLGSLRPNYFIIMGYLSKMRSNQQCEPPYLYTHEPPSEESWIRPWLPIVLSIEAVVHVTCLTPNGRVPCGNFKAVLQIAKS